MFSSFQGIQMFFVKKYSNRIWKTFSNFNLLLHSIQLQYQFSKMQHQQKLGNFIGKLNFLLSNPEYSQIICWDKSETMIDILSQEKMEKEIIPLYFRHHKYESFVRQLNLYGFKKVKFNGRQRFTHPQLQRGEKILSITSHKTGSARKEQKEHTNEHLSHEKTSESAGNNAGKERALSPTLNSITQSPHETNNQGSILAPGATGGQFIECQDQRQSFVTYPQQFVNYWNMLMMHSTNQIGGYVFINPMQIQQ